jgi:AraC family transcriptional regulator
MRRAYGETMGEYFTPRHEPLAVQSAALSNHVAVTHICCDGPGTGITDPIPAEPALLLALQLRPLMKHDLWLDGRSVKVAPYASGALTMLDLRTRPVANLASGYECVQMYFPQTALHAIADAEDTARLNELPTLNGAEDPVLAHLAHIAKAAVSPAGPATSLFLESMLLVVHGHLSKRYAGQRQAHTAGRGALAPWQESRAKEYIEAHLHTNISLLELAAQCQLSPSYFGRAFKASTGIPPHRWLVGRRIARVRQLLAQSSASLVEIAQACGFSDQSHLAREFRRAEGSSLSAWRRAHTGGAPPTTVG